MYCLDLEINRGDSIAITGVSGSGKSTLLNILSTIYG
ncbi:MAG: ATP-binding cassette domain-containing protein, partial [Clostridia bacterium]